MTTTPRPGSSVTFRSGTFAGCLFTVAAVAGKSVEVRLFSNPNVRRFARPSDLVAR